MRQFFNRGKPRRPAVVRAVSILLRALALLAMSFAAGFGFLAAIKNPQLRYNPHTFAVGAAALFGAACGVIGLLVSSLRSMRVRMRDLLRRLEDLCDQNWELKEGEERAQPAGGARRSDCQEGRCKHRELRQRYLLPGQRACSRGACGQHVRPTRHHARRAEAALRWHAHP